MDGALAGTTEGYAGRVEVLEGRSRGSMRSEARIAAEEKRAKIGDALRDGTSWRCKLAVNPLLRKGYNAMGHYPAKPCAPGRSHEPLFLSIKR